MKTIRVGTRKSELALVQTRLVIDLYEKLLPEYHFVMVPMSTKGDEQQHRSLNSFGGKGVFVTAIEQALSQGEIDLAVHSAKDLPVEIKQDLTIVATPQRADVRDVLVLKREAFAGIEKEHWREALKEKRLQAVGTGSLRRQYQLRQQFGFATKDIRGNVPTRLAKLEDGAYDGVMLAAAGLERLGLDKKEAYAYFYMDAESFLPAPCQGIIAVEARKEDPLRQSYGLIEDVVTRRAFEIERKILELTEGSCKDVIGALAVAAQKETQMKLQLLWKEQYQTFLVEDGVQAWWEKIWNGK